MRDCENIAPNKLKGTLCGSPWGWILEPKAYSSSSRRLWFEPWMPMWQFWQLR